MFLNSLSRDLITLLNIAKQPFLSYAFDGPFENVCTSNSVLSAYQIIISTTQLLLYQRN